TLALHDALPISATDTLCRLGKIGYRCSGNWVVRVGEYLLSKRKPPRRLRAQDAFVALPGPDRKCYQRVKEAVLRAYEQVPEFYRQRFRNLKKEYRQTYSEVARELVGFFNRWCSSVQVDTYEKLRELMVLEQFKNVVPERLAM